MKIFSLIFAGGAIATMCAIHAMGEDGQRINEIYRLRAMGQAGLDEAFHRKPEQKKAQPPDNRVNGSEPSNELKEWREFVDAVAGQRDAWASRLYWYTDIEEAKREAHRTNRPILSLRLLGKLTDEQSCANSRFFRKTLYPNEELGNYLRDHFILHWESVRPVPVVTIDFGDGRTLKRTITGNSIHYILDAQGRLVDALPGLYDPQTFQSGLVQAYDLAKSCSILSDEKRIDALVTYHSECISRLDTKLSGLFKSWGITSDQANEFRNWLSHSQRQQSQSSVDSNTRPNPMISPIKLAIMVGATSTRSNVASDKNVMLAIRGIERPVERANATALPKNVVERPIVDGFMMELEDFSLRRDIDTVQNEYGFHRAIHAALADPKGADQSLQQFTEWAYSELFLAPLNDPWYGLRAEAYDGYDYKPDSKKEAASKRPIQSIDEKIMRFRLSKSAP